MPWQSLRCVVPADVAEPLSEALLEVGALSVSVEDAAAGTSAERPIFAEPGAVVDRIWDLSTVEALLEDAADAARMLDDACKRCGCPPPQFALKTVADADWVRASQAQFAPIRVSSRLWIVPTWHAPVDEKAINIVLDPGLAFGTGSHPTTQLCLNWLEASIRGGESVLDYGCGSGILAIAAAKLGAGWVGGVDIDPDAVIAARANAVANAVVAEFVESNQPLVVTADLVVANILANPLKVLAPAIAGHARRGGKIALAGLLSPQADELVRLYAPYCALEIVAERDGWALLAGARR